ncbi:MAG: FAD:protein FMN transferase [Candidatus Izemoplasmatales bacterium]|nr:FAD:protein FMN transferase [Candidatus Izemoplasmatales bacterium]MDD4987604.1 FAD:protein FMN transferase [Candidatus Izemoplasmatales bacterium]MDD5601574.1 FAD:protein FMN transferase [Candidatus Izemoplasmatales bacterium]MDY0373078.1 FAD:protein FMN transferase [Candidatus Izemoplasmatales bacterium]
MKKFCLILLLFSLSLLLACQAKNPNPEYCAVGQTDGVFVCSKTWSLYFGPTPISLKLYLSIEDEVEVEAIYEQVESLIVEYHQLFDKYHEYDGIENVYTINHHGLQPTILNELLYDAIAFGLAHEGDIQVDGVNLFNIALGPVLSVWHDARESSQCVDNVCPIPRDAIDNGTFATDSSKILLNPANQSITFLEEGMAIDLGGYGKGYVAEVISDYLDTLSVNYLLNAGNSNLKAGGENPDREDGHYYIGLIEPNLSESLFFDFYTYLRIPDGISIVTSGNYQNYFFGPDLTVYHHIIDPRTHYPGGEAMSVTILSEDGALLDIYSTAIYLMTVEEGLDFVNQTDGMEGVWYLPDKTIVYSDQFESLYLYQLPE